MLASFSLYTLTLYFITTVFLTIFKRITTIKGLVITFTILLLINLLTFISLFDLFIYKQCIINLELIFFKFDWRMFEVSLHIKIDMLSYLFILLVLTIGFCTNIYILNYFKFEAKETTFYVYINWFIISMILFVLAENGFTLFLGWELIGLTSFLLINFWTDRRGVLKSAFKAFSFNKVSDALLLSFLIILWYTVKHSQFSLLEHDFVNNYTLYNIYLYLATIGLIICAGIKSAQLFMHVWLPDSMEAPVPASALIHSATLVSAGVYLLLRFSFLLAFYNLYDFILVWGSITGLYGGIVAAAQTDVKKLLAYSTISHCGFLFVCVGLQWTWLTITYLFLHGLFKAATFFCVGSFIRINKSQDSRLMGINNRLAPTETLLLIICASNLGGLPFTLGFFYKKFFLAISFFSLTSYFVLGCCIGGMLSSLVYVYRLINYTCFDINKNQTNLVVKMLQNNENKVVNYWSFSSIIHIIAIILMLLLTFFLYQLLITLILTLNISFEQSGLRWIPSANIINNTEILYDGYYYIFYLMYNLIGIIICCVEWRYSYTSYYKWYFITFFVIFIVVGFIYLIIKTQLIFIFISFYDYLKNI
uniref:NADH dehydrogenase subunit 5 n=1 Tax=Thuricola similis TaxID=2784598 RepID=A0A7T8JJV3_9CILI|nr:NADH dehydrogenase subunit 5 [Thuricola similis]QQP22139.1 NADH dehydrogenase subunit 5 [Thuricola similis]